MHECYDLYVKNGYEPGVDYILLCVLLIHFVDLKSKLHFDVQLNFLKSLVVLLIHDFLLVAIHFLTMLSKSPEKTML